jgi:hypothetical protein
MKDEDINGVIAEWRFSRSEIEAPSMHHVTFDQSLTPRGELWV